MNKKIEKLSRIAADYAWACCSSDSFENYLRFYTEKFSELIIQECAEVAMDNLSSPASAILCHFESD